MLVFRRGVAQTLLGRPVRAEIAPSTAPDGVKLRNEVPILSPQLASRYSQAGNGLRTFSTGVMFSNSITPIA
jgi:hypothetical protein